jgi:hypothetical protein
MSKMTRRSGSDQPCSAHTRVRSSRNASSTPSVVPGVLVKSATIRRNVVSDPTSPSTPSAACNMLRSVQQSPPTFNINKLCTNRPPRLTTGTPGPQIGHRTSETGGQTKPVRVPGERPETGQSDDLVGLLVAVISHGK